MSERMNVGGVEDRKMKRKVEEVDEAGEHFLSLSLCNNADMSKPLTVSKPGTAAGSGNKKPDGRRKEFRCKYCVKDFKSSQALGGHQNAHRRERVMSKMAKLGHPHLCPCSSSSIITRSRGTASTSSFNPHFRRLCNVPSWIRHHQARRQPKPAGLSFGMKMNSYGKPNVSSSGGLDLSLRL